MSNESLLSILTHSSRALFLTFNLLDSACDGHVINRDHRDNKRWTKETW